MDPREALARVAKQLGTLRDQFAFLGGATAPIHITDVASFVPRPTKDADAIVPCKTYAEYLKIGAELKKRGFVEDDEPNAPICRWVLKETGIKFDVMPTDPSVLRLAGRWFEDAFRASTFVEIAGESVRVVSAPYFIATKLEAFRDRGHEDYLASHDLEDIISVVDGRPELVAELAKAAGEVRDYVRAELSRLLAIGAFVDALPGHLGGGPASQGRLGILKARLLQLAARAG